jgi:hypothetical protein
MKNPKINAPAQSSVQHYVDRDKFAAEAGAASAECKTLQIGEAAAARAGVEILREHRRKMEDAKLRHDVAFRRSEDSGRLGDEALEHERDEERLAAYQANQKEGDAWAAELPAYIEHCRWIEAFLKRGKQIQSTRLPINRELPAGFTPLEHIEANARWLPAEPDRQEEVEVEREVVPDGRLGTRQIGKTFPKEKVKEMRVIPGHRAVMPKPLWERFEAAGLKPYDPHFGVS